MFKEFLMKKLLQAKMKDVPKDQQEKVFAMMEKNPDLFTKIGKEIEEAMKSGRDQMTVTMEVMKKYQDELKKLV